MTKTSDNKKVVFLKILEENKGNIFMACKKAKIVRQTYYNWLKDDENFRANVDDVFAGIVDGVEGKLLELISKGNYKAIEFYLKSRGKDKGYSNRNEIEVTGSIDTNIIIRPYGKEGE